MAAWYCMRGSRKHIIEWGCLNGHWCLWWGEEGSGSYCSNFTEFYYGKFEFFSRTVHTEVFFRIVEIIV